MIANRIAGALVLIMFFALPAHGSCLPLSHTELWRLDAQTEARPELAIGEVQQRLAAGARPLDALLRAELFAVLADAYTEQSRPVEAHAAVTSSRAESRLLPGSPVVDRLRLRLELLEAQWSIALSHSDLAVAATSKLLLATNPSLERACILSMRATAYDYLQQTERSAADALVAYRLAVNGKWLNAQMEIAYTLARIFGRAGLYPQAETMLDDVFTFAAAGKRIALLSTLEYERGILLVGERRFADARTALEQAHAYASQAEDRFSIAAIDATLCWALLNEGDLDAADKVCNTGDADLTAGHRTDLETLLAGYRARLDLERHRPLAALAKLNAVLTADIHAIQPRFEPQLHWDRARALSALHRYREAAADLVSMHELDEALDIAQRNRQVAVLSAMIASEGLAAENRQLEDRVAHQQEDARRQQEKYHLWTLLSASALMISALLGFLLWTSRRHDRLMRRQATILRTAGTCAPDAFLLLDEHRRVRFANRNLCGQGPVHAVGEPVGSALPAALVSILTAAIDQAFQSRNVVSFFATNAAPDGELRQFEMCVVPAIEQGRVVGGTLRSIDVTEQRRMERQVVDGASRERRRLSSELHEGLGQQLAGVLLLLGNALNAVRRGLPSAAALIEEIAAYVQQGIESTRELARGLAPAHIGGGSFRGALHNLERDAARLLRVHVQHDCRLERTELSDLATDHLYWICREAITNAAVHGCCANVRILVKVEGDLLWMSIADDGRGFANDVAPSKGLGVKMMAYRMRLMGGEFKIEASSAGGTAVLLSVPLQAVTGM